MSEGRPVVYVIDGNVDDLSSTKKILTCDSWGLVCLANGSQFLNVFDSNQAGCLVLDVQMDDMSGLELQQMLSDWNMDIPVIFVTATGSVANSVKALKAGAIDFIQKPISEKYLVDSIEKALQKQQLDRAQKHTLEAAHRRFSELTEREWEVLTCMVSGPHILSSKEVARELEISHRTVEHHRAHIMDKTQSSSLPELIRLASFIGIANPTLEPI